MAQTNRQERLRSLEKVALEDFFVYLEDNGSEQYHVEVSQKRRIKVMKENRVCNTLNAINIVVKIVKEVATIEKRLTRRQKLKMFLSPSWSF